MELLINKAKVSEVLQVAIGYNEKEFNVFIREAQDFDLKPLLCEEFYFDLVKNKADEPYKSIIDGGEYEYDGRDYAHRGIGDVLAYLTYARFFRKSNNVSTSHGFVKKTTPQSVALDTAELNNMYYKYKKDANTILEDVKKFALRNIDDYPTWNYCKEQCGPSTRGSGFQTHVIK